MPICAVIGASGVVLGCGITPSFGGCALSPIGNDMNGMFATGWLDVAD